MVEVVDKDLFMEHFEEKGNKYIIERDGRVLLPAYRNGKIMIDYLDAGFRHYYPEAHKQYFKDVCEGYYRYSNVYIQNLMEYQKDEHVMIAPIISRGESNKWQEISDLIICMEGILKKETLHLPLFQLTFLSEIEVYNSLVDYFDNYTYRSLFIYRDQDKYLCKYIPSIKHKVTGIIEYKTGLYDANGEILE